MSSPRRFSWLRENWYRDVWLTVISLLAVFSVIFGLASNDDRLDDLERQNRLLRAQDVRLADLIAQKNDLIRRLRIVDVRQNRTARKLQRETRKLARTIRKLRRVRRNVQINTRRIERQEQAHRPPVTPGVQPRPTVPPRPPAPPPRTAPTRPPAPAPTSEPTPVPPPPPPPAPPAVPEPTPVPERPHPGNKPDHAPCPPRNPNCE